MEKFGCPSTFIAIVRHFHGGMTWVVDDGEHYEAFQVTNGVKQSCVLAQGCSVDVLGDADRRIQNFEPG